MKLENLDDEITGQKKLRRFKIIGSIKNFERALEKLDEAEKELNRSLEPLLKGATDEILLELIEILPVHYKGVRRLYEALNK